MTNIRSKFLTSAAIVKGLIEHADGRRFFGSLMAYTCHLETAIEQNLVMPNGKVTPKGTEWYERCLKSLPQSRPVFWKEIGSPKEKK